MGKDTKIAWCNHTFNPWWGCQRISPGCDHCYAADWAKRTGYGYTWTDPSSGAGAQRRLLSDAYWREPLRWDESCRKAGRRDRVFAGSMCDIFDNDGPSAERDRLFRLIRATECLDWLLLTKRIGNAKRMLPADWGHGYPNAWLGISVVNQEEAERDIPKLLALPASIRFLSCEPLLGPIDLRRPGPWDTWLEPCGYYCDHDAEGGGHRPERGIDWVIVGGESGAHARPMASGWAYSILEQCAGTRVAFFMKQLSEADHPQTYLDFDSFPHTLRVRQWPRSSVQQGVTA